VSFERIAFLPVLFFCRGIRRQRAGYAAARPGGNANSSASIPKTIFPPWVRAEPTLTGALGSYSMMRDSSGTRGRQNLAQWMPFMGLYAIGPPCCTAMCSASTTIRVAARRTKSVQRDMLMGMAQRQIAMGTLTLRAMLSLDPLMGKSGIRAAANRETANENTAHRPPGIRTIS